MTKDDRTELVRQAQMYFLAGRVIAELHAIGGTMPGSRLLDPHNFALIPGDNRLRISSEGMAHVSFSGKGSNCLSVAERVESLGGAAVRTPQPHWNVFAAGYREGSAEMQQSEIAEATLLEIDGLLEQVQVARSAHASALAHSTDGHHHESIALLEQEIAIWKQLGMDDIAGRVLINLGADQAKLNQITAAETSYQQAYDIATRHADSYGLVMACAASAIHYQAREDKGKAEEYAREGLAVLSQTEMPDQDAKALRRILEKISGKHRTFWRW